MVKTISGDNILYVGYLLLAMHNCIKFERNLIPFLSDAIFHFSLVSNQLPNWYCYQARKIQSSNSSTVTEAVIPTSSHFLPLHCYISLPIYFFFQEILFAEGNPANNSKLLTTKKKICWKKEGLQKVAHTRKRIKRHSLNFLIVPFYYVNNAILPCEQKNGYQSFLTSLPAFF